MMKGTCVLLMRVMALENMGPTMFALPLPLSARGLAVEKELQELVQCRNLSRLLQRADAKPALGVGL